jgi:EmrB/QacA subfamily drug resistance transporter
MPLKTEVDPGVEAPAEGAKWLIPLLVLVAGMFMSLLDTTIVTVAIPHMQNDFGATTQEIQWVTTGYTLALGVVVPLSGWLGDRFGLSRVYLWGMVGFAATSALCGIAWSLDSMIVFRVLQAIPGGVLPVAAMSMVYRIVPRAKIGSAMGIYGIGVAFAPAVGPTLGGYLVEYVDWRLIFYINAPIGIIGAAAAYFLLPKSPATSKRTLDWWGFGTIGYAMFALLLAVSKGQDWHWGSYKIMLLFTSAALSFALFVVIELELDEPLIELRVLKNWPFVNSLLLIGVLTMGLQVILFFLPLFIQNVQGYSALPAGLLMLPESLVMVVLMPLAGNLYDRFGSRWPAVIGLSVAAYGTWMMCQITPDMTRADVILWTCVRAAGNGLALMPIMTGGLASIPRRYTSSGTTLNNIMQRVAGSLGLSVMTVLQVDQQSQLMADRSSMIPAYSTKPQVQHTVSQGTSALYGLYQQLQAQVVASSYSDVFYMMALVSASGVLLALMLRKGPSTAEVETIPTATPAVVAPATVPEVATPEPMREVVRAGGRAGRPGGELTGATSSAVRVVS